MVRRQVANAFKLVGDLAFDATLLSRNVGAFDFSFQTAPTGASGSQVVRAVRSKEASPGEVSGTLLMEIFFSAEGVPTPDIYDKVVIDGVTWNVVPPFESDGYVITMRLAREA
jgi:hypothetical protein